MRRLIVLLVSFILVNNSHAQSDSTASAPDTIKVGNFIIVKKHKNGTDDYNNSYKKDKLFSYRYTSQNGHRKRVSRNVSTNWGILDIGFANLNDNTNYTTAQSGSYLKVLRAADGPVTKSSNNLNAGKSSNVNIWIFMQKLNITKHILNLKYGVGLEMYNFRFDKSLSYRNDANSYIFNDSISFSKNKLYVGYLTVPLMINVNTTPSRHNGFSFSVGVSAGYLIGSHNKQISSQRGKQKINGSFDLQPFRLAGITELGLGPVRLYGSYSFNALHKESTGLEQFPYTLGIRFSNW